MNIVMEEKSENCKLQYKNTKSRSHSDIASRLPRPGKRDSIIHQLMSNSSMFISGSFDDQTGGVSTEVKFKESWSGERDQERLTEGRAMFGVHKYFLICNSCFWCASYFGNHISSTSCPLCLKGEIDSLPIGEDENYAVNLSLTNGVEFEFSNDSQALSG